MELRVKFYLMPYHKASFEIINPATVPAEGELMYITWEDFLDDQDAVDAVRKLQEEHAILAHIESRSFWEGGAQVTITLKTEYDYHKDVAETKEYIAESLKAGRMIDIDELEDKE